MKARNLLNPTAEDLDLTYRMALIPIDSKSAVRGTRTGFARRYQAGLRFTWMRERDPSSKPGVFISELDDTHNVQAFFERRVM